MRELYLQIVVIVLGSVGLIGCQSGPRWAWWKPEAAAPSDTSLVARSAPTTPVATATATLPSQHATPQTIAAQNASSVPTTKMAAASSDVPAVSLPSSSATTLANAPVANYSATVAANPHSVAAIPASSTTFPPTDSAASISAIASPPATPSAADTGPYDPQRYRGSSSIAAASASAEVATADRYGTGTAGSYSAPTDRYGSTTSASVDTYGTIATNSMNRYGTPSSAPVAAGSELANAQPGVASAAGDIPSAPPAGESGTDDVTNTILGNRYAVNTTPADPVATVTAGPVAAAHATPGLATTGGTQPATASVSIAAAPSTATTAAEISGNNPLRTESTDSHSRVATLGEASVEPPTNAPASGGGVVNLVSSPGQYRPGGTSTYLMTNSSSQGSQIDVASRPTSPTSIPATPSHPAYPSTGVDAAPATRY